MRKIFISLTIIFSSFCFFSSARAMTKWDTQTMTCVFSDPNYFIGDMEYSKMSCVSSSTQVALLEASTSVNAITEATTTEKGTLLLQNASSSGFYLKQSIDFGELLLIFFCLLFFFFKIFEFFINFFIPKKIDFRKS